MTFAEWYETHPGEAKSRSVGDVVWVKAVSYVYEGEHVTWESDGDGFRRLYIGMADVETYGLALQNASPGDLFQMRWAPQLTHYGWERRLEGERAERRRLRAKRKAAREKRIRINTTSTVRHEHDARADFEALTRAEVRP